MEPSIKNIGDITYSSELTLDIEDVKGLIRTNKVATQRRLIYVAKDYLGGSINQVLIKGG
jgi:hypothetical protein